MDKALKIKDIRAWIEENVLTSFEASEYLHMSRQGIHWALQHGKLKAVKPGIFLKTDLDEYDKTTGRIGARSR